MIEFKITNSPDKSQQATYQHLGRELTFGRTEGDMLIDDPAFGPLQLKIVVTDNRSSTIESLHAEVEVRLNGKPIVDAQPLKEKDNVTVSRTTINFIRLDLNPLPVPEPYENPAAKERFQPGAKEKVMLDVLEHLERAAGVGGGAPPPPPPVPAAKPPPLPGRSAGPPPLPKKS